MNTTLHCSFTVWRKVMFATKGKMDARNCVSCGVRLISAWSVSDCWVL